MRTTTGGPVDGCDKAHGVPCEICSLSAEDIVERFTDIVKFSYSPVELRKLRRKARGLG